MTTTKGGSTEVMIPHSHLAAMRASFGSFDRKMYGLYYNPKFISHAEREEILAWLSGLHPIWDERYSKSNPPPAGKTQRRLLRPVYWLGNWQFACLNYYHPPKGILNRCVA